MSLNISLNRFYVSSNIVPEFLALSYNIKIYIIFQEYLTFPGLYGHPVLCMKTRQMSGIKIHVSRCKGITEISNLHIL